MPDTPSAIRLNGVTKTYRLFGSQRQQLIEVLGLNRLGLSRPGQYKEFSALRDVTLEVPRGARVGVVGRNGAGKTTLLKLVCGNFTPTSGTVEVNGTVQALMSTGIGFHPEYTGRENAVASLQYNGLSRADYDLALQEILDFCELGDFIDQAFKTYSLGMQARLMFATATAIKPDILIVDEVLGAGDAYFVAKSRRRMEDLVRSGCTMLLVSHSMQQVLEMCQTVVWLDQGTVRMQGDAFDVVKAYEEYINGTTSFFHGNTTSSAATVPKTRDTAVDVLATVEQDISGELQEPPFKANLDTTNNSPPKLRPAFNYIARGGLSRWKAETGVKLIGFDIENQSGSTNELATLSQVWFTFQLVAEVSGHYELRYGIVVDDTLGRNVMKVLSPKDSFHLDAGLTRTVRMLLNPIQLGPGDYISGVTVLEYTPVELLNQARRYDLLSRSFEFKVRAPDSLLAASCQFFHSADWFFE